MSSLLKFARLTTQLPIKKCLFTTSVRQASHWNYDYYPEKHPKTKEEKAIAAKKYGMHPDEYEPYEDDGFAPGDYPKLPWVGNAAKDAYYPWDNPVYRRNFNEPVHWEFDMIGEDRFDAGSSDPVTGPEAFGKFLGFVGVFGFFYYLFEYYNIKFVNARAEKQYPGKGDHYVI